jgi:hypothetical protein
MAGRVGGSGAPGARDGQSAEYFQHVGQLAGKVVGGGVARLLSFFCEPGQQRLTVAHLV